MPRGFRVHGEGDPCSKYKVPVRHVGLDVSSFIVTGLQARVVYVIKISGVTTPGPGAASEVRIKTNDSGRMQCPFFHFCIFFFVVNFVKKWLSFIFNALKLQTLINYLVVNREHSNECRKTKTKVITKANHNKHKLPNKPITTRHVISAGKRE